MSRVEINPDVLRWAMNRARINSADLGHPGEKVVAWLEGSKQPTFNQAQKLAKDLRIPLGYLFLPSVPEIEIPIPDLRSVSSGRRGSYSTEFIDVLYDALRKQSWYRSYRISQGYDPLKFVGSFDLSTSPKKVADNMREWIDNSEIRQKADGWQDYLRLLTQQAESLGVLVLRSGVVGSNTHRPLAVEDFRAFAVVDDYAPVVFLNTKDSKAALVFSLAHELAHLWVGQSAISDTSLKADPNELEALEQFCNKVAAEFLVPESDFEGRWNSNKNILEMTNELAPIYRVSGLVILRRAYELAYIPRTTYLEVYPRILEQLKGQESKGGGNFFQNLRARNGRRFVDDLVSAVASGLETYKQAASLLGVSIPVVSKLVSELGGKTGSMSSGEILD